MSDIVQKTSEFLIRLGVDPETVAMEPLQHTLLSEKDEGLKGNEERTIKNNQKKTSS